jgi:hypothetical protein
LIKRYAAAPVPAHRLIPSRFPPIGLFDTVATAADLEPVMELAGWTNDRLVTERINRLPRDEWVYGRPNASIVMAAFLHVTPGGMRFNSADLGAWYAAAALTTSVAEVAHHMRREAIARGIPGGQRKFRQYTAALAGSWRDSPGIWGCWNRLRQCASQWRTRCGCPPSAQHLRDCSRRSLRDLCASSSEPNRRPQAQRVIRPLEIKQWNSVRG